MIRRWEILFYLETHFSALRREYAMKWVGSKQLSFIWAKWLFSCEICRFGNDWIKWLNAYFPILDDTKEGSARFLLPSSLFSPSLKGTFYGDHHRSGIDTITTTSTHFSRGLYSFSFWSFFYWISNLNFTFDTVLTVWCPAQCAFRLDLNQATRLTNLGFPLAL